MKIKLTVILFLTTIFCGFSQNDKIDSLKKLLNVNKSSIEKMKIYDQLTNVFINNDITKSQVYNDSLLSLSSQEEDEKMKMYAVYNNGVISRMKGDYGDAEKYVNNFLEYTNKIKDSTESVKAYYQLATIYVYQDKKEKAIKNYLEALKYLESSNYEIQKAKILNGIGVIYKNTSQYQKAKEYHSKAAKIALRQKDSVLLSIVYNGLGIACIKQDSTKKALNYFKTSLNLAEKTNNVRVMGYQYRNIGTIYSTEKDYTKAEYYLEKALILRKQMKNKTATGGSLSDLANIYIETNRLKKAEDYLNEAISIFKENESISGENTMYYYLSMLESKRGNAKKAVEFLDRYYITRDSLEGATMKEKISDIEIKYESEKKDKELAEQQLAIEQHQLQLQKKQSQYKFMTGLTTFLLISSLLIWFLYQQNKKRKNQEIVVLKREQQVKTLELLMEGEEKERFRIAKELHDGVNVDLSAIKYKLTSLLEKNNEVINEAVSMIDKSCEQVRAISHNLVPPALKDFTLVEALQDFCITTNAIHDTKVTFQNIGNPVSLSKKAEANIFRIVQELVNNSLKHAEASEIDVQLSHQEYSMQLTIEDNGKGFDVKTIKNQGIGLQNVNSRIEYLNAKLDVTSDSKGTSYVIDMNIKALS